MYPIGVFATDDGGAELAAAARRRRGRLAGRRSPRSRARRRGRPQRLVGNRPRRRGGSGPDSDGARTARLNQLRLSGPQAYGLGWSATAAWSRVHRRLGRHAGAPRPGPNCPLAARHFDFAALAVRGPEMLDRRLARHARLPHRRRRPHLAVLRHRLGRAASRDRLRRRPARLGRRRTGHDPGHRRRRPDLAAAAVRRLAGRLAGRFRRSGRRAPGAYRPAVRQRRIPHASSRCSAAATSRSRPATTSTWPTGCTRRWSASAGRAADGVADSRCARPACASAAADRRSVGSRQRRPRHGGVAGPHRPADPHSGGPT